MRLVCALLVSFLAGGLAKAETMEVRAGEHGVFTRLVLAFESLPQWNAGRTEDGYAIGFFGSEEISTDLSRTFALINRARLSDVSVAGDDRRVDVTLACECHAEFFELRGTTLVIDIYEGPAAINARFEAPYARENSLSIAPVLVLDLPDWREPPAVAPRRILGGRGDMPIARPIAPGPLFERDAPIERLAAETQSEDVAPLEAEFTQEFLSPTLPVIDQLPTVNSVAVEALTQQLGRAAAQGLIEAVPPGEGVDLETRLPTDGPQNFRVFTGVDRATGALNVETQATLDGRGCFPNSYVDIGKWGDPKNAKYLGPKRQNIVKETGAIDFDAMLALSQYYVALGFGAEARFAARQLPESERRSVLLALADIVDVGETEMTLFSGQLACPGKVALWAALAGPFKRAELPISTDTILTTFSALPPHLREHLGPTLSQRLRNAGETALARAALSAVTRAGSGTVGQELTAARLELVGTRAADARANLERIAQGTNVEAAEALVELLQDARRRKVVPKPEWVDDAESLIRVTEGTRTAEELNIAVLRGHVPLGRFDALRRSLTDGGPGLTPAIKRDISAEAIAAAVTDADTETFIRTELGLSDFAGPDALDSSTRYELVDRFLDLGIPSLAAKYLPETAETPEELRLTAATVSALDRKEEALALLVGEPADSLADVRADLLSRLGDYSQAATIFEELGRGSDAELQALRSGDWLWISEEGPEALSDSVRTATAPETLLENLRENSALIDDLSRRRAAYIDLLDRTTPITMR